MPYAFNRAKSPPKARGTATFSQETTKRTEDNHSLLADEHSGQYGIQKELFGQFKGFTISPIKSKQPEVVRPAPPVPTAPLPPSPTPPKPATFQHTVNSPNLHRTATVVQQNNVTKSVNRTNLLKPNSLSSGVGVINSAAVAPALPPMNPGSTARPIISSPILENSTCTAKELLSPLRNAPKIPIRPAPEAPKTVIEEPKPLPSDNPTEPEELKKSKESMSTINRIASFLKSNDKKPQINSNSLPRNTHKLNKNLDKTALRSMEISEPIPQNTIEIANALPVNTTETKNVVMRAQSMRGPNVTVKPNIQSFGSMRQPNGLKRPISIPSGVRPKSPPPPRPPVPNETTTEPKVIFKVPNLPGYQPPTSKNKQNQYDDCLNESLSNKNTPSSDNIYAVIEETPISSPDTNAGTTTSSGSSESVGLLGEIVSEIQSRNLDSIYSTNTLTRKKDKDNNKNMPDNELYVNTASIYKTPDNSEYSNTSNLKSSASSTSSGYITPAAVNSPMKEDESPKEVDKPKLNTFKLNNGKPKNVRPSSTTQEALTKSTVQQQQKTNATAAEKSATTTIPPSPTNKTTPLNRQATPPNLRTRKPSPTRNTVTTPKPTPITTPSTITKPKQSNSPDLVTSCANSKTTLTKPPDVLNVRKPLSVPAKPILPKTVAKVHKSASVKNPIDKKPDKPPIATKVVKTTSDVGPSKTLSAGAKATARQSSTVAALQQKFENKTPMGVKPVKK